MVEGKIQNLFLLEPVNTTIDYYYFCFRKQWHTNLNHKTIKLYYRLNNCCSVDSFAIDKTNSFNKSKIYSVDSFATKHEKTHAFYFALSLWFVNIYLWQFPCNLGLHFIFCFSWTKFMGCIYFLLALVIQTCIFPW